MYERGRREPSKGQRRGRPRTTNLNSRWTSEDALIRYFWGLGRPEDVVGRVRLRTSQKYSKRTSRSYEVRVPGPTGFFSTDSLPKKSFYWVQKEYGHLFQYRSIDVLQSGYDISESNSQTLKGTI